MGYSEELREIPDLAATGEALVNYAKSLIPKADFVKKHRRWVCEPNFLTFEVQPRKKCIKFTIYGLRYAIQRYKVLPLSIFRSSYREFVVESPSQLAAAAMYIATAAHAYSRKHHDLKLTKEIEGILLPVETKQVSN